MLLWESEERSHNTLFPSDNKINSFVLVLVITFCIHLFILTIFKITFRKVQTTFFNMEKHNLCSVSPFFFFFFKSQCLFFSERTKALESIFSMYSFPMYMNLELAIWHIHLGFISQHLPAPSPHYLYAACKQMIKKNKTKKSIFNNLLLPWQEGVNR